MKRSYSKLLTPIIALGAFFFACSAIGDTTHYIETIFNNTNDVVYVTPTSHYRVDHPNRFKVTLAPFSHQSIYFSAIQHLTNLGPWGAYINQHLSIISAQIGEKTKCFQIRFDTARGKSKIEPCGKKNDVLLVHKRGSRKHYYIFIYKKIVKLHKK